MGKHAPLTQSVLQGFGLTDAIPEPLSGGSTEVSRVGDVVLKHISQTSLENNHSPDLAGWIAEFSATISQDGFRLPRGIRNKDGRWVTPSGWTAWSFVEGKHATATDIPASIAAITKLHLALVGIAKHPLLDDSHTPWAKAHAWCLGEQPDYIHPVVAEYVTELYRLRRPVPASPHQLMHGDLNPENILIAEGLPPAFLDFSPFWGPPELALAIFANWIGPRRGDAAALSHFENIPNFGQLLVRAAIRMLLVMSESWSRSKPGNVADWQNSSEKNATEIIFDLVQTNQRGSCNRPYPNHRPRPPIADD